MPARRILIHSFLLIFSLWVDCADGQSTSAFDLTEHSRLLFHEGKTDSAFIFADSAIHVDQGYLPAYSSKCDCLWELKRNEEALTVARQAMQITDAYGSVPGLLGLAFEHVREPESAKAEYKRAIAYAGRHRAAFLPFPQMATLAAMLTVTKGKYYGLQQIELASAHRPDSLLLAEEKSIKSLKNEINAYQGGGLLEFVEGEPRQYCLNSNESMESVSNELLDKGINIQEITKRQGGFLVKVKDKFRARVVALGLIECR
ncbi:MAG TPA: hypothetical protein VL633_05555 [Bacteroidota bacterium]|nr:hypothetical protein [Bacteroidota bacterium]